MTPSITCETNTPTARPEVILKDAEGKPCDYLYMSKADKTRIILQLLERLIGV